MSLAVIKNKTLIIEILAILAVCLLFQTVMMAQNVGINNPNPHTKAMLDITSNGKGMLIPRMTESERNAMFPVSDMTAKGMLVYQTDNTEGLYKFNGIIWEMLTTDKSGWNLAGNTGTNPANNFLGTTDNQPVIFRTNNTEKVRISQNGKLGIGITNPTWALDVLDNQAVGRFLTQNHSNGSVIELRNLKSTNQQYIGAVNFNDSANATPGQLGYLANQSMTFRTNGIERARINGAGNMGIGTSSPTGKLEIISDDPNQQPIRLQNTSATGASSILLSNHLGNGQALVGFNNSTATAFMGTPTAHPIVHYTSGIERMRITATGNVGIGTITPVRRLHLDGTDINPPMMIRNSTPNSYSGIHFDNAGSTGRSHIGFGNTGSNWSDAGYVGTVTASPFIFTSSDTERMRLTAAGRLGIGIVNPSVRLHLADATGLIPMMVTSQLNNGYSVTQYYFDNDNWGHVGLANPGAVNHAGSFLVGSKSLSPVDITTADVSRIRISSSGNVGIGTINPASKLEVDGFTKLGSNAPAIKTLELNGTTSAMQGGNASVLHGLNSSKIIGVSVLIEYAPGNLIANGYIASPGFNFNYYISSSSIWITNIAGASSQILLKPFKVLVTYKE